MTNAQIRPTLEAIVRLTDPAERRLRPSVAMRALRTARELEAAAADFDRLRDEILDRHAERDDDGQVRVGEDGNVSFATDEARGAAEAEFRELLAAEAPVEIHAVDVDELGDDPIDIRVLAALAGTFVRDEG